MQFRLALVAVLPFGLTACGAVVVDPTPVEQYNALATEYNDIGAAYSSAFIVPAGSLPVSGTAVYDGVARIDVDTVATTRLLGEAQISANFTNDTIAAQFGNFFGRVNGGNTMAWEETSAVTAAGVIDVTQAGGLFIQTEMTGALESANGDTLLLGTTTRPMQLDGTFRDTAPGLGGAPDAMVLQSGPGSIRLNGLNYSNDLGSTCETCVRVVAQN